MKSIKIFALPIFLFAAFLLSGVNVQAQGGTEITILPGTASPFFYFEIHEVDCGMNLSGAQGTPAQLSGTGVYYPAVINPSDPSYVITVYNSVWDHVYIGAPGNSYGFPQVDVLPTGETVEFNGFYPCSHPSVVVIYP